MIFTLSGRNQIDVYKSIFVELKENYMINHDVMDIDSRLELLENIVDLGVIIDRLERENEQA